MSTNPKRLAMRPGAGWSHLSGPVWEHTSRARIHMIGMIRLPDKKTYLSINNLQESELGHRLIRINGGNRKRGLMAWAMNPVRSIQRAAQ